MWSRYVPPRLIAFESSLLSHCLFPACLLYSARPMLFSWLLCLRVVVYIGVSTPLWCMCPLSFRLHTPSSPVSLLFLLCTMLSRNFWCPVHSPPPLPVLRSVLMWTLSCACCPLVVLSLPLLAGSHLGSPIHFVVLPFPPPHHEVSGFLFHLLQCQPMMSWVCVVATPLVAAWGKTGINVLYRRSHNRLWAVLHMILTLCFRLSSCVTGYVSLNNQCYSDDVWDRITICPWPSLLYLLYFTIFREGVTYRPLRYCRGKICYSQPLLPIPAIIISTCDIYPLSCLYSNLPLVEWSTSCKHWISANVMYTWRPGPSTCTIFIAFSGTCSCL